MPPLFYDSQAAAAAALKIDVYDLRDAKREGCPAFRTGRVYREICSNGSKRKSRIFSTSTEAPVCSDQPIPEMSEYIALRR